MARRTGHEFTGPLFQAYRAETDWPTMKSKLDTHSHRSVPRERIVERVFVGEMLRRLWQLGITLDELSQKLFGSLPHDPVFEGQGAYSLIPWARTSAIGRIPDSTRDAAQRRRSANFGGDGFRPYQATFFAAGIFHVPLMIEGDFSLGQYIRSIRTNLPDGAGSQFDSLPAPGDWFWM